MQEPIIHVIRFTVHLDRPTLTCLGCSTPLNAHAGDGPDLEPDSLSYCMHCGHTAIVTATGGLREPAPGELYHILRQDPRLAAAIAAADAARSSEAGRSLFTAMRQSRPTH